MRIGSIHIDAFGEFMDCSYPPLERPLTVVYGPNEAGKTTLLAFIRHVLFGFPHGNTRDNRYMIEEAGRHGGRLQITTDDDARYTIDRQRGRAAAGTVTVTADDGTALDAADLPRLMGHASRQMFESIFTFDLDELASFNVAGDAEIASRLYGAGAGVARLPNVLRDTEQARNAIFVARGRNQPVAEALGELEKTEAALRLVRDQASEYRNLSRNLDETNDLIVELDGILNGLGHRRQELDRQAAAWNDWIELRNVRRRLKELPQLPNFPEAAVSRLERLEERSHDAQEAVVTSTANHQKAQDNADLPISNEALLGRSSEINFVREQRGAFIASLRDLPDRQAEANAEASKLAEELRSLGIGWTQERVEEFDVSLVRRDVIDQWREKLDTAEQDRRGREQDAERLQTDLAEAEQREKELDPDSGQQLEATVQDGRLLKKRLLLPVIFLSAGIGLAVIGVLAEWPLLSGLGIGTSIAGAFIAVQFLVSDRSSGRQVFRPDEGSIAEAQRATERLRRRITISDEALQEATRQAKDTNEQWIAWLRTNGLPESLTPGGAREFLSQVIGTRVTAVNVRGRQERAADIQRDIDRYRSRLAPIAEEVAIALDSDNQTAIMASAEIISEYDDARTAAQDRKSSEAAAVDRKRDVENAERFLESIYTQITALLKAGGADGSEEFRRLAAQHATRQEQEESEQDLTDSIQRAIGPHATLSSLDEALTRTSLEMIESELADVKESLAGEGERRDNLLDQRGQITTNLDRLQGDEEASRLRATRASLIDQLQAHAEDWSRLTLAHALLERTRQRYERDRQPAVLARASTYFARLTRGRYERIYQPLDTQGFRVIETGPSQRQKTPAQLSRGTREQLYLALRFAAVDEFGKRQERLPVIVDEVLVNFDPQRAAQAAAAFAQVAERNQVIVFTCHPWVRDAFQKAVPGAGILNLD